jgi:spore coat protein CotH
MSAGDNEALRGEIAFYYNFLSKKGEYAGIGDGDWDYWNYIDVESFVDYFLVAELVKCADAGSASTYMYRPIGGKLTIGPLWDSDMSMGNFIYADSSYDSFLTLQRDMIRHLLRDARFSAAFVERWRALRATVWSDGAILGLFDEMAGYMAEAAAQDAERWPSIDGDVQFLLPASLTTTWEEEIERTREWLVNRLEWLDKNIPLLAVP